nr:MAG TPA: hypothetical protein [Caudoviricetes sp.]
MTRTEFENKIEELAKSEEHQEFAKNSCPTIYAFR